MRRLKEQGVVCNLVHLSRLKPMELGEDELSPLEATGIGLVIDAGFEICGLSRDLAYRLMEQTGVPVRALGLEDKTKLLCPPHQNASPDIDLIVDTVKEQLMKYQENLNV